MAAAEEGRRDRSKTGRGSRSARKNQPHARAGSRGELSTSGIVVERPHQRESQRTCQEQDWDQHHLKHLLLLGYLFCVAI